MDEYVLADYAYLTGTNENLGNQGWCVDMRKDLAEFLGVDVKTVSRKIDKLVKLKILKKHPSKPWIKTTQYFINTTRSLSFEPEDAQLKPEDQEKNPKIISFIKDVGQTQAQLILAEKEEGQNLPPKKKALLRNWLNYLFEVKSKPIQTSIQAKNLIADFKSTPIVDLRDLIKYSMDNNYPKIYWDRLKK